MKNNFKIISFGVLLLALVAGAILVQRNQETRRGAAIGESSVTLLPSTINSAVHKNISMQVWVNTGKATNKLSGAEVRIGYNPKLLKFINFVPMGNGYTLLNESNMLQNGVIEIKMVAMGDEKSGSISLGKLNFTALGGGNGDISIKTGSKLMVSGQNSMWDVAKMFPNNVKISGLVPTGGIVISPTNAPINVGCENNSDCGVGAYCFQPPMPPCNNGQACTEMMPAKLCKPCTPRLKCMDSLNPCMPDLGPNAPPICPVDQQAGLGMMCGGFAQIVCKPGLRCQMNSGKYVGGDVSGTGNSGSSQPFYVDESGICVKDGVIVSVTPKNNMVTLLGRFGVSNVKVGDELDAVLVVESGLNKVSSIKVKASFNPKFFEILRVEPMANTNVINNTNKDGVINLFLTWSMDKTKLPTSPAFALVRLKAIAPGVTTFGYDRIFQNEVSGIDANGKSTGFALNIASYPRILITNNVVSKCQICNSGMLKKFGNANCDNAVNTVDFEIWRNEVFDMGGLSGRVSPTWKSDFNCDGKVSIVDFEKWRETVFK